MAQCNINLIFLYVFVLLHLFCSCSIIIANEVKLILYCKRRQEIIIENIDLSTDKMEMVLAKQLKSGISFNLIKQSIKNQGEEDGKCYHKLKCYIKLN